MAGDPARAPERGLAPAVAPSTARRPRASIGAVLGRTELLVVAAVALGIVGIAWFLRTGAWKRGRVAIVALVLVAGVLLATRRLGWGELLVVLAVVGLPVLLLAPRRPAAGRRR